MDISVLQPDKYEQYEAYLQRQNSSMLYYSIPYMKFLNALIGTENSYLIAHDSHNIHGILPLMSPRNEKIYNSLPYFGSHGGIIADTEGAANQLIEAYNNIISNNTILASTLITNPFVSHDYARIKHNYKDYRIGMFTDISYQDDPEMEILARLESVTRRNINKAKKENIRIEINNNSFEDLKFLHQENIQSLGGIYKTEDFFKSIPVYFLPDDEYRIYFAKKENQIIAALLLFYYGKTVEYFVPAIHKDFRDAQGLSLIIINAMIDAAKKGFKWWNWGGTWKTQEGVYRFKKKWATLENKYYYLTQLNSTDLLFSTKEQLLNRFPNFFVVSFDELRMEKE